jgi:oxazoline/thiazoline dehydrogenase
VIENGTLEEQTMHGIWESHDLAFHLGSRGITAAPNEFGGTFRFGKKPNPETAWKPQRDSQASPRLLPVADLPACDFNQLLASRATTYNFEPATFEQMNGLLYQSFRVRGITGEDQIRKAYPSGGSLHSLELYVVINECEGLEAGVYHYDGFLHALRKVPCSEEARRETLQAAASAMARGSQRPAAVLVVTARFARVFWKYQGLGYRLILLEAGALLQTFYLAAAQLGLSVCAVGSGPALSIPELSGDEGLQEGPILELAINGSIAPANVERAA